MSQDKSSRLTAVLTRQASDFQHFDKAVLNALLNAIRFAIVCSDLAKEERPIMIRPLTSQDYSQWHTLWYNYLSFYETELENVIFKSTFTKLISKDQPNQNALVSENRGALTGLVHFIVHPHNWKNEDVVYLQDLYTEVPMRDRGIGRALIEAVYKVADENGTPSVYWLTQDHNHVARHLYDRIGTLTPFIKYNR